MSRLKWDQTGERKYETGTKQGVLYVQNGSSYNEGIAWNGLTAVTESPSGAEANDMWADNIKYGSLRSAETFGGTIEAYTYPDEFKPCNGENELIPGVSLGQQKRNPFAFSYVSDVGNDTPTDDDNGYKIHIIYNATASPAEKPYTTVNDSPEAITFSWEISTTPIDVPGFKPTASLEIDTTNLSKYQKELGLLDGIEDTLYGTENTDATLMLPNEVAEALEVNIVDAEFTYQDEEETIINGMTLPDLTGVKNPVLAIPEGTTKLAYAVGRNKVKDIVYIDLPEGLKIIENEAFCYCNELKTITIPDSVTSIGDWAFGGCYVLTTLTIPDSVTSIGDSAFGGCHALTTLTIPNSVTSIGAWAFGECYVLTSLTIPDSVTSIGDSAFGGCKALTSLTIGISVTSIGAHAFNNCWALTSLTIPDSVTSIGDSAFNNCYALTTLTIGNSVTSIGDCAFFGCYALTTLTIPNSVTSIGDSAFNGCNALTTVDLTAFDGTIVPELSNAAFYADPHAEGFKFVFSSQAALDAFAAATNWANYADYFEVAS